LNALELTALVKHPLILYLLSPKTRTMNKKKVVNNFLAGLNGLTALASTWFFISHSSIPFNVWLVVNFTVLVQFVTIPVLLEEKKEFLYALVPALLYFGLGGLFLFSWQGLSLIAHASHLVAVGTAVYAFSMASESSDPRALEDLRDGLWFGVLLVLVMELLVFPLMAGSLSAETLSTLEEIGFKKV
jgi:hypothetical protein